MARRWGTTPHELRRTLTYDQLGGYIRIERFAIADEGVLTAYGTAAAIGQALGGKKSKALKSFAEALRPKGSVTDTANTKGAEKPKGIADYKAGMRELLLGSA
ncbi:MAG: hypothetical protein WBG86_06265 [Polyangiales bacterium]